MATYSKITTQTEAELQCQDDEEFEREMELLLQEEEAGEGSSAGVPNTSHTEDSIHTASYQLNTDISQSTGTASESSGSRLGGSASGRADASLAARETSASTEISREMRITFNEHDGVFANMAAKPQSSAVTGGKIYEELEPPSYHETVVDPAPDYFINCVDADSGEVLIEGLPMGNFALFFITMFISMTFDILGFFLTTMLAASHAARLGSQAGLGLTLMRYGALLRERASMVFEEQGWGPGGPQYRDPEEEKSRRLWSATFILCMGVFVCIRALVEFIRLRRMKAMIASTPLNYGF